MGILSQCIMAHFLITETEVLFSWYLTESYEVNQKLKYSSSTFASPSKGPHCVNKVIGRWQLFIFLEVKFDKDSIGDGLQAQKILVGSMSLPGMSFPGVLPLPQLQHPQKRSPTSILNSKDGPIGFSKTSLSPRLGVVHILRNQGGGRGVSK